MPDAREVPGAVPCPRIRPFVCLMLGRAMILAATTNLASAKLTGQSRNDKSMADQGTPAMISQPSTDVSVPEPPEQ